MPLSVPNSDPLSVVYVIVDVCNAQSGAVDMVRNGVQDRYRMEVLQQQGFLLVSNCGGLVGDWFLRAADVLCSCHHCSDDETVFQGTLAHDDLP
ncbi:MAG: hypothetical protein DMG70_10530 [Acidobacteria bacterium]|nr:MAG: hypothetical protein DMG70_10530 [Acidobacteriota bacterium]PYY06651.1 MAG: hypothetical protein DMG69_22650 [Acidobacteriota bacterium]